MMLQHVVRRTVDCRPVPSGFSDAETGNIVFVSSGGDVVGVKSSHFVSKSRSLRPETVALPDGLEGLSVELVSKSPDARFVCLVARADDKSRKVYLLTSTPLLVVGSNKLSRNDRPLKIVWASTGTAFALQCYSKNQSHRRAEIDVTYAFLVDEKSEKPLKEVARDEFHIGPCFVRRSGVFAAFNAKRRRIEFWDLKTPEKTISELPINPKGGDVVGVTAIDDDVFVLFASGVLEVHQLSATLAMTRYDQWTLTTDDLPLTTELLCAFDREWSTAVFAASHSGFLILLERVGGRWLWKQKARHNVLGIVKRSVGNNLSVGHLALDYTGSPSFPVVMAFLVSDNPYDHHQYCCEVSTFVLNPGEDRDTHSLVSLHSGGAAPMPASPMKNNQSMVSLNGWLEQATHSIAAYPNEALDGGDETGAVDDAASDGSVPVFASSAWYFITELCWLLKEGFVLVWSMGYHYKWMFMSVRVVIFALAYANGFAQFVWWYLRTPKMIRHIWYGPHNRNVLDIVFPVSVHELIMDNASRREKRPVVVLFTGGAWIIGFNAWGAMLASFLAARGAIVVLPDYRNFPQSDIDGMVDDVSLALDWTIKNIQDFGGDLDNITAMGQSAGAHLITLTMLRRAKEAAVSDPATSTTPSAFHPTKGFASMVGLSGLYNLVDLESYLHSRGLYKWVLHKLCGGREMLEDKSPCLLIAELSPEAVALLPPTLLIHGTCDASAPYSESIRMSAAMNVAGAKCSVKLLKGQSHTDPFVDDSMRGSSSVADILFPTTAQTTAHPKVAKWQLALAAYVCPF